MGLLDKLARNNQPEEAPVADNNIQNLNQQELEFLLQTLKVTTFTGEHVEFLYNLIVKLQKQYIQLQK